VQGRELPGQAIRGEEQRVAVGEEPVGAGAEPLGERQPVDRVVGRDLPPFDAAGSIRGAVREGSRRLQGPRHGPGSPLREGSRRRFAAQPGVPRQQRRAAVERVRDLGGGETEAAGGFALGRVPGQELQESVVRPRRSPGAASPPSSREVVARRSTPGPEGRVGSCRAVRRGEIERGFQCLAQAMRSHPTNRGRRRRRRGTSDVRNSIIEFPGRRRKHTSAARRVARSHFDLPRDFSHPLARPRSTAKPSPCGADRPAPDGA
jgi:hypothetical protein